MRMDPVVVSSPPIQVSRRAATRVAGWIWLVALACTALAAPAQRGPWLSWRGPQQNGCSVEVSLPAKLATDPADLATAPGWTYDVQGRGTPVVDGDRLYCMAYEGEGMELEEMLLCLDANTGEKRWERRFTDYISDVIYSRYAIGSPTVDPETGHVFCLTTPGELHCFTPDGEPVWGHDMAAEYGRLTFPNGRTGAPLVVGELCIVHVITSSWGKQGPARDRFFAFEKATGRNVWSCTPGGPPKDSSFSMPVVDTLMDGRTVLYAGLGGGHMVCVDVLTGDPLWKFQMSIGGVNSSALLYDSDKLIAIHGKENLDSSVIGRMICLRRDVMPPADKAAAGGQMTLEGRSELWRNDLCAFTSSPVLVGKRVFQTDLHGDLCCIDADSGEILWKEHLAPDQIHASPAYGSGMLYVPMNNGSFHVIRPDDGGATVLQSLELEGNCLGAPAIANGRVYVHTTKRLYCFSGVEVGVPQPAFELADELVDVSGPAMRLQIRPGDVLLRPGERVPCSVLACNAAGVAVDGVDFSGLSWDLPEGVIVKDGVMAVADDAPPTSAVVQARIAVAGGADLVDTARLRIVPNLPVIDDFSKGSFQVGPDGVKVGPPRRHWLSAFKKWEIRELDGEMVLARNLDNPLFQRTQSWIGHPDDSNYTVQVDIMTDGNRRTKSSGGVINQRYLFALKGNYQTLEVSSNMERFKHSVKFKWNAKAWYTLKTQVVPREGGGVTVQAKVWPRGEDEPEAWTIQVDDPVGHTHGAAGVYGFTPQSRFRVYLDNLKVTPNG